MVTIKFVTDSAVKRVSFEDEDALTFAVLLQHAASGADGAVSLRYQDEDGDIVDIANEADLAEAIRFVRASGKDTLRIRVAGAFP